MKFTYTAGNSDRDRLRLFLGDTKASSGPLPQGEASAERTNFYDTELDDILDYEGTLYRAMAHCLEILAAAWTPFVSFQGDGIAVSRSHAGRNYWQEATDMRKRHGYPDTAGGADSWPVIRIDGYNEDLVDSHEVDN